MDNSLEYAKMIEIPVKTCEYSFKRKPLFLRKKKLINAVNKQLQEDKSALISGENNEEMNNAQEEVFKSDNNSCDTLPAIYDEKLAMREKRKNTIISAQVVAIFALISAIILTNACAALLTFLKIPLSKKAFAICLSSKIDKLLFSFFSTNALFSIFSPHFFYCFLLPLYLF